MKAYVPQDNYNARQRAKGRARVTVWIPADQKDHLTEYAGKLCKKATKSKRLSKK